MGITCRALDEILVDERVCKKKQTRGDRERENERKPALFVDPLNCVPKRREREWIWAVRFDKREKCFFLFWIRPFMSAWGAWARIFFSIGVIRNESTRGKENKKPLMYGNAGNNNIRFAFFQCIENIFFLFQKEGLIELNNSCDVGRREKIDGFLGFNV